MIALLIHEPMEYVRVVLDGEMQGWIDAEDGLKCDEFLGGLNISIDYLLNDVSVMEEKEKTEEKNVVYAPTGKISITSYDNKNVVICQSVKTSPILWAGKDEPKYVLNGVDKITFWGEHTMILGWYATLEDVEKEISEITKAIQNGENAYKLKYNADVEDRTFGSPKLKK